MIGAGFRILPNDRSGDPVYQLAPMRISPEILVEGEKTVASGLRDSAASTQRTDSPSATHHHLDIFAIAVLFLIAHLRYTQCMLGPE